MTDKNRYPMYQIIWVAKEQSRRSIQDLKEENFPDLRKTWQLKKNMVAIAIKWQLLLSAL